MELPRLESDQVNAYYDREQQLVRVHYRGQLVPDMTISVYAWINDLVEFIDIKEIRGGVYDFRSVTAFHNSNLGTVQRVSQKANINHDFSHIGVALLVGSLLQEQMVRLAMKITPQETRKRIVKSEAEALAFIDAWQQSQSAAASQV
jgi:hypothetical protein